MATRETYVISAEQLSRAEPALRRTIAVMLWCCSWFGNLLAIDIISDQPLWWDISISLVVQLFLSLIQYVTCYRWLSPLYLISVTASSTLSYLGFRNVIAVPLTTWMTGIDGDLFTPITRALDVDGYMLATGLVVHLLVWIGLIAVDVIPERVFVKH